MQQASNDDVARLVEELFSRHRERWHSQLKQIRRPEGQTYRELSKITATALAGFCHTHRNRAGELLRGQAQWSRYEVERVIEVLGLSDDEASSLSSLADHAREGGQLADVSGSPLVCLNQWNRGRPLLEANHRVSLGSLKHPLPPAVAESARNSHEVGRLVGLTGWSGIDWAEAPGQERFDLEVAEVDYKFVLATASVAQLNKELLAAVRSAAESCDVSELVRLTPFANIAANVNVVSSDERVVLAQRSGRVKAFRHEWNLGVNEGMKPTGEAIGESSENFFDAAKRTAREELGVPEESLDAVVVNWFGYCTTCVNFYVFSHVRTSLTAAEIEKAWRLDASHGHEIERLETPELTEELLSEIGSGSNVESGAWLHHATVSAERLEAAAPLLGVRLG